MGRTRHGANQAPTPPYSRDKRKERFATILAAEDLEAYTHARCQDRHEKGKDNKEKARWPARERGPHGIAARMLGEAEDAYCYLVEANDLDLRIPWERGERLTLQRKALTRMKLLNHHIEFTYSQKWIGDRVFEYWTALVDTCRNQAAAWHKSDKERAAAIEKAEREQDLGKLAKLLDELRLDRQRAKET